jgi:hypothetical protein
MSRYFACFVGRPGLDIGRMNLVVLVNHSAPILCQFSGHGVLLSMLILAYSLTRVSV